MAEDIKPDQPEHLENHEPVSPETSQEQAERLAKLEAESKPQTAEQAEQHIAEAREQVAEATEEVEQPTPPPSQEQARPHDLSGAKRRAYTETLNDLQAKLPPTAAGFSRLIHRPLVEKISEATAKTLMRPSLTLGIALGTVLGGGAFLYLARRHGFGLTGGEFLLSAGLGGLFGLLIEGVVKLLKRGPRRRA